MNYLKQSTTTTIQLGPFLDDTDGKTAETGLTISSTDVYLSKAGAAFANPNDTNAAAHDRAGWYRKQLNSTDTNSIGRLIVEVQESGALPVWREFMILPANVYDSLVGGTDSLEIDVTAVSGDSTAADNLELDYDGTGYAKANSTTGTVTTNTDLVTAVAIRTEIDSNSSQLAAIAADTNELQTDDVPGLIAALNDPTAGAVADQVWEEAIADHSGTSGSTAEALDGASAPTAAAVADAVLDEALSGHTGAGSLGKAVADIETDVTAVLADSNELQTDDVPGLIAALNDPTAGAIADQVWEEAIADHSGTSGSTAEALDAAGGGVTAASVADAVWEETLADHSGTSGSTAEALGQIPGAMRGAIEYTYNIDDGADPIEGAEVWITTDSGGNNVIWSGVSDALGIARASDDEKPWLDAGTYYGWAQKTGFSFSNPDTLIVS